MSIEDYLYKWLRFYKTLPYPVKLILGKFYRMLPYSLRFGSFYQKYVKRIRTFDIEKEKVFLRDQLEVANLHIPFYKNCSAKDLMSFPVINKHIVRERFEQFVKPGSTQYLKANTGGASGTPFEFYLEKNVSRSKERAHFDWYWKQFGYKPGCRMLVLRGESLFKNKLFEYEAIDNKLAISCFLLNKDNIERIIHVINRFKPSFVHGYPSAVKNFIFLAEASLIPLNISIRALFLGSEMLFSADRELIGCFFNSKIAHWYGHSERLVFAGNCPFTEYLHIYPFYGYVELIDDKNVVIETPNVKGRIVATGFDNKVMPLIRYDTGDEAEYANDGVCECGFKGRSFRKIYGRNQDYVFLNDDTKVSLTAFIFGQHFEEFSYIKEMQLEQIVKGELIIRMVVINRNDFNVKNFVSKLRRSVSEKIQISIAFMEELPKTGRGKHVFMIQKVKESTKIY